VKQCARYARRGNRIRELSGCCGLHPLTRTDTDEAVDQRLDECLHTKQRAFAEDTLFVEAMVPIEVLRRALCIAIEILAEHFAGEGLHVGYDRHEADGVITKFTPKMWSDVKTLIATDESLYQARSGEILVSIGVYSESVGFYLRSYIMEEDEDEMYPGRWGDLELSTNAYVIAKVRDRWIREVPELRLATRPATAYFAERRY